MVAHSQQICDNPLTPADTSSPRATLSGFIDAVNKGHAQLKDILKSYLSSSRLYLSDEERMEVDRLFDNVALARRTLNLSELPAALMLTESFSRICILQLKEVLDRLELPALESIPDAAAMESKKFKRWTLPGTEITIARVEQGPRAGEYLFSPRDCRAPPRVLPQGQASSLPAGRNCWLVRTLPLRWCGAAQGYPA